MAHPIFGRSVNPISTRGDRLCPPNYYWHTRIFRPSDGPALCRGSMHRFLKFPAWLAQIDIFHIYLNHTIDLDFGNRINGMINMEGIPKFDIKFDIGIKLTTWIGHQLKTRRQMT
jgi:hypothetical protein